MSRKKRRFMIILCCGAVLSAALALVLVALKQNITFFRSPSDIIAQAIKPGTHMRIGGLVEKASIMRSVDNRIIFSVSDGAKQIKVAYQGLLPDLFKEGQGVVAEGELQQDGSFKADTILAKHDENYMPREVTDALKKQGVWQGNKK